MTWSFYIFVVLLSVLVNQLMDLFPVLLILSLPILQAIDYIVLCFPYHKLSYFSSQFGGVLPVALVYFLQLVYPFYHIVPFLLSILINAQ